MKKVPEFKSEEEEFEFWSTADSTEYVDWSKAKRAKFPNLKPTLRTISVRLPVAMVEDLKILANQRDVPYQPLLKVFLAERLEREKVRRLGGKAGCPAAYIILCHLDLIEQIGMTIQHFEQLYQG